MKPVAIVVLWVALTAAAFPVVPLVSEVGAPYYEQFVTQLASAAREEVLVALSDLRLYPAAGATHGLLTALAQAASRGVKVQVLLERRETDLLPEQRGALTFLAERGVSVREDPAGVTLHAKFLVVDRRWVVVGSTHWTSTALTRSTQVDLALDCPELAQAFAQFFTILWEGRVEVKTRLPLPTEEVPHVLPLLELPTSSLHAQVLPAMIDRAQSSVDVLLYRFAYYPQYPDSPSNRILEALRRALGRGVRVRVLLEDGALFPEVAQDNRLAGALLVSYGAQVRLDHPDSVLHAKCLIVDDRDVLVSSANWSYYSLARNVEAGVAFFATPELAWALRSRFESLWKRARPLG